MNNTDLQTLANNLEKKNNILTKIFEVVKSQDKLLEASQLKVEIYDSTVDEIDGYVDELEKLDESMSDTLARMNVLDDSEKKKNEVAIKNILNLVDVINKKVTDIQQLMNMNKEKLGEYLTEQYKDVGNQKKSVAGIKGYFKSMGVLEQDSTIVDNKI